MAETGKQTSPPLQALVRDINRDLQQQEAGEPETGPAERYGIRQYIRFAVADILMAVPLFSVLEIGRHPRITSLPNLPGWVLGVSNIRGEIISMIDLKAFFGIAPPSSARKRRFIVIHNPDMKVGIIIDRIIGILTLDPTAPEKRNDLYDTADAETLQWTAFVSEAVPMGEMLLHVIDVGKLLTAPRMNAFRSE